MDEIPPPDIESISEPEPSSPPSAKVFLGGSARRATTLVTYDHYKPTPESGGTFWMDLFKVIVFFLVLGGVAGGAYYYFFWLNRLPQERDLTDWQGKSRHVQILGHDDLLLKYSVPGSETVRYLSLATLSPTDQEFIAKLKQTPLAQLPLYCTLTDSAGNETAVRLNAHNDNWVQYALISDGSTHYASLSTLIPSDQAVIRLLPADLNLEFPMNFVFEGAPRPGVNVQLLGRNDDILEYLLLATGQKYFTEISELSQMDQSFVREFPRYIPDRPPQFKDNGLRQAQDNKVASSMDIPVPQAEIPSSSSSIDPDVLKALVIVKGDYSQGSGFIVKMHDQYFVVTNEHVLSGNKEFTITDMDGHRIPTNGDLYGAVDYDMAILRVPDSVGKHYLEIMSDPQSNAKVGDHVTVPGNSLGAGVPTQINGDLTAIGPELVEVTAQLQHGISGSPIIDRPSGKVIGIATMSITYSVNPDSPSFSTDTRWFGYRVDNIDTTTGWVKMDWSRFRDEGIKVRNAIDLYDSLDALLRNKSAADITSDPVKEAVSDFQAEISQAVAHNNKQDAQDAYRSLSSKLSSLADSGTSELTNGIMYPYHANIVKNLDDLRKFMDQAFQDDRRTFENLAAAHQ